MMKYEQKKMMTMKKITTKMTRRRKMRGMMQLQSRVEDDDSRLE